MITTNSHTRQMKLPERNTVLMVHDSINKINGFNEIWRLYPSIEHIFKKCGGFTLSLNIFSRNVAVLPYH
jgi:hypothetical protein